jgi:hypothetical protein
MNNIDALINFSKENLIYNITEISLSVILINIDNLLQKLNKLIEIIYSSNSIKKIELSNSHELKISVGNQHPNNKIYQINLIEY